MKKFCKAIIVFICILIVFILLVFFIMWIRKVAVKNMRKINEEDLQKYLENTRTTIDVTGIILGKETQHEHVYKTMYDENKHWEECIICKEKRNETEHSLTTTWALGYESCEPANSYTKVCKCGYSKTGHKACVWNGYSYITAGSYRHARQCQVCNDEIVYSYYLNYYGSGKEYNAEYNNKYLCETQRWRENCYKADGSKINCNNLGMCQVCGRNFLENVHVLNRNEITDELVCELCKRVFGTCKQSVTRDTNIPARYTFVNKITMMNGATIRDYKEHDPGEELVVTEIGEVWDGNQTTGTLTTIIQLNSECKQPQVIASPDLWVTINGVIGYLYTSGDAGHKIYPDIEKPTITNISVESSNSWSKNKTITITGTENWTDTVSVEILDDEGNSVYTGKGNVTNGNYSISCIPELEAGVDGRKFTAIVTDACDNSTEQEFIISKIDSVVPEITSSDKVSDGWAKEKNITFTASDHGIGNVQIAFNDVSDYELASKNGTEYSKEYKLVGDVYSPREANVYYKDELGNISTKSITINQLDNTAPTITGASFSNNKLNVTAYDRHETEGEGSGVAKYRFITSATKLENPEITPDNSTEVSILEDMIIPDIYKVKYVYVVAEDLVGNIGEVYEVEVPQLSLTSKVNLSGNNGKGAVELDWSEYDISNKYFVIYRKQENESNWETVVSLEQKLTDGKYTDVLGNDKTKPSAPSINIEGSIENNTIQITRGWGRYRNKIYILYRSLRFRK